MFWVTVQSQTGLCRTKTISLTSARGCSLIKCSRMLLLSLRALLLLGLLHFFHMLLLLLQSWDSRTLLDLHSSVSYRHALCCKCINTCTQQQQRPGPFFCSSGAGPDICGAELLSVCSFGIPPPHIGHIFFFLFFFLLHGKSLYLAGAFPMSM